MLIRLSDSARLYHGDNRDVLRTLPDNSIDSVVTDPPYALVSIVKRFGGANAAPAKGNDAYVRASSGFMNAQWDVGDTAFSTEFWSEVFRVLKPGGHVAAFSATRTQHRLVCAIEDAGFEIRDQLYWHYGSGFPKSQNVAKFIDKELGETGGVGEKKANVHSRGDHKLHEGWHRPWMDDPEAVDAGGREYLPASSQAQKFDGYGTALKPATEPICLARKPLGTGDIDVRRNVEKELRKCGITSEIVWVEESAETVNSQKKNTNSLREKQASSVENVTANEITNIEPTISSNFAHPIASGTPNTDKSISMPRSDDMTNCDSKFCSTTDQSANVAGSPNLTFSRSTTSMAADPSTEKLSDNGYTQTSESAVFPKDIVSYAGIVTGLFDCMECVLIKRKGNSFVWPEALPTFVPSKPLTVAANVLRWGTGALNIGGCRIGTESTRRPLGKPLNGGAYGSDRGERESLERVGGSDHGRWPANVVLSYPEDEYELRSDVTDAQRAELEAWFAANS